MRRAETLLTVAGASTSLFIGLAISGSVVGFYGIILSGLALGVAILSMLSEWSAIRDLNRVKRGLGLRLDDRVVIIPYQELALGAPDTDMKMNTRHLPGDEELAMILEYDNIPWKFNMSMIVDGKLREILVRYSDTVYVGWYRQNDGSMIVSTMTPRTLHNIIITAYAKYHVTSNANNQLFVPRANVTDGILSITAADGSYNYIARKCDRFRSMPILHTHNTTHTVTFVTSDEPAITKRFQFETANMAFASRVFRMFIYGVPVG